MLEVIIIVVAVALLAGVCVQVGFNAGERNAYEVIGAELLMATQQRKRDNATDTPIGEQVARDLGIQP